MTFEFCRNGGKTVEREDMDGSHISIEGVASSVEAKDESACRMARRDDIVWNGDLVVHDSWRGMGKEKR